jgi:hypothetical protein
VKYRVPGERILDDIPVRHPGGQGGHAVTKRDQRGRIAGFSSSGSGYAACTAGAATAATTAGDQRTSALQLRLPQRRVCVPSV